MDAGVIIAIVVGGLILVALLMLLAKRGRDSRHETRRHEARELRREADVRTAEADEMKAEAEERAARARREDAAARQQVAHAQDREQEAEAQHARAHDLDPDAKGDYERGSHRDRESEIDVARTDAAANDGRNADEQAGTSSEPVSGEGYEERRVVREGDPDDPDVVREERVRGERQDR